MSKSVRVKMLNWGLLIMTLSDSMHSISGLSSRFPTIVSTVYGTKSLAKTAQSSQATGNPSPQPLVNQTSSSPLREVCVSLITANQVQYTINQIMKAQVDFFPYPHMHIQNIFQPDLYACMIESLPTTKSLAQATKLYTALFENVERYSIQLLDDGFVGPGVARVQGGGGSKRKEAGYDKFKTNDNSMNVPFWTSWAKYFGSEDVKTAYMQKMKDTLLLRTPKALSLGPKLHWDMSMNRDMTGYEIGPHTDSTTKWVTILYYLPPDANAPRQAGTSMLRSKSGKKQKSNSEWSSWKDTDFEVIEQTEFIPNSVFVFSSCFSSWHAVPKIKESYVRDTIQAFIRNPKKIKVEKQKCPKREL